MQDRGNLNAKVRAYSCLPRLWNLRVEPECGGKHLLTQCVHLSQRWGDRSFHFALFGHWTGKCRLPRLSDVMKYQSENGLVEAHFLQQCPETRIRSHVI
jgi:hypothetical protein